MKLTKDQADALCARLQLRFSHDVVNDIKKVIKDCTKEDFPEMKMDFTFKYGKPVIFKVCEIDEDFHCDDPKKKVFLRVNHCEAGQISWAANLEELKLFASDINKIVEWLDENN